jgi:hypothetical protein
MVTNKPIKGHAGARTGPLGSRVVRRDGRAAFHNPPRRPASSTDLEHPCYSADLSFHARGITMKKIVVLKYSKTIGSRLYGPGCRVELDELDTRLTEWLGDGSAELVDPETNNEDNVE